MKRIKMLMIIILILTLTTGCSVEYNIIVNNDNIKEEIIVNDTISQYRSKTSILEHYNKWYPTYVNYMQNEETIPLPNFNKKYDGIKYHEKSIKEINNGYQYKYLYKHNLFEYSDSYALANTFKEITVQETPDVLVLKTSRESYFCNYNYFDSIKINITFNPKEYKINYTNSTNIKDNTYTWTINNSNCKNSEIVLTLNKITDNKTEEEKAKNDYTMYIFCSILLVIITLGYIYIKRKKSKLDDFDIDD